MRSPVKNSSGAPLAAEVEIRDRATGRIWKHQTDKDGFFIEPVLRPDNTILRFKLAPIPISSSRKFRWLSDSGGVSPS